jgi:hypothetical protein
MDITKAEKIVMFSYVPLLYAPPQMLLDELTQNNIEAVAEFMEGLKDGNATGCLWVDHNGQPAPVFVYPNAHEIAEHLHLWTEEKPTQWFHTHLEIKDGKYLIILIPQIDKSIERWKINFQLTYGYPPPKDLKFEVFFKPLYFVSGTENTLELIADRVKHCPNIGFMNMDSLDFDDPDNTDPDAIVWLGPFRKLEGDWAHDYFHSILDDSEEPTDRRSILFDAGKELKKKKNREKRKRKRRK